METISAAQAKNSLLKLIDDIASSHEPIFIRSKKHNAVLLPEDVWLALNETIYLLSIPGMRKSIQKGMKTPFSKCSKSPKY